MQYPNILMIYKKLKWQVHSEPPVSICPPDPDQKSCLK